MSGVLVVAGVAVLGVVLVVAAVLVHSGASLIGLEAVLAGAFLVATSPFLAHVTGRAIRQRQERRR